MKQFIIALLLLATSGCMTFNKAHRKFATDVVDTTYATITATVPRDSVIRVFKTDSTHYVERVRQGRATVTIIREPTNTTIIANCDSASIKKGYITRRVIQKWGVAPWYQKGFWIAVCLLVVAAILYIFLYHLQLSISKR